MDEGNLKISNLVEEDEGKYECAARNDKGTRLSSGDNLLVRAKRFRPHFTKVPSPRQIVPPGGRLSLSCTAVGAPVPTVDWYRGSRRLQQEKLEKQLPGTARILLLDLSESVNVTCVAESSMGRINHEVQVVVKTLPSPPGQPYLVDVGSQHARIAFEPSPTWKTSPISSYLVFWVPKEHFSNHSLYTMPNQANSLSYPTPELLESFNLDEDSVATKPKLITVTPKFQNVTKLVGDRVKIVDQGTGSKISRPSGQYQAILANLSPLKPYMEYMVWSRAVGSDGDASLPSQTLAFTTQEIAPTSPPRNVRVQAISNAAVTVYWDPPLEPNGLIRVYRIYHTSKPSLDLPFWDTSIVNLQDMSKENQQIPPNQDILTVVTPPKSGHLFILSHLITNATYYIRVSAVNGKGESPASDTALVIVRPGLLSSPRNLTAVAKSSQEVQLHWIEPDDVEQSARPLLHYSLEYAPVTSIGEDEQNKPLSDLDGAQVVHLKVDVRQNSMLISGLQADTQYVFRMASVTASGSGVRAIAYARTKKFVPAPPSKLSVTAISSTELQVSWKSPTSDEQSGIQVPNAGRIAYYELSWRPSTSSGGWLHSDQSSLPWAPQSMSSSGLPLESQGSSRRLVQAHPRSKQSDDYSAVISGLQPSTFYVVHLRAVAPSGSGDRAIAAPIQTWDRPPAAPRKLRLFSQIIPPTSLQMPPQVLIKVAWEPPITDGTEMSTPKWLGYRIRWRLLLSSPEVYTRLKRTVYGSDVTTADRWLFWAAPESKSERKDIGRFVPDALLSGELNTTETNWNPTPGCFLLGMIYEFRVAVITAVQLGQESIEQISIKGAAPSSFPIDLKIIDKPEPLILQWSPPDWAHRHGGFMGYEVRCRSVSTSQVLSNGYVYQNVTPENSGVRWPDGVKPNPRGLIAWPQGHIRLRSLAKIDKSQAIASSSKVACQVRVWNAYGSGPWSPKSIVYPKPAILPPPPGEIRALRFPTGEIRVSWAMPSELIQSLSSNERFGMFVQRPSRAISDIIYKRFAIYLSPRNAKNWTRHLTSGPVTELIVPSDESSQQYLVRVSSIGIKDHEGTWSDSVLTHQISRGVAIHVSNLNCSLLYLAQTKKWSLKLTWQTPSALLMKVNAEHLMHYRVNYTKVTGHSTPLTDGRYTREFSHRVEVARRNQIIVEHTVPGLHSNATYLVSVRPVMTAWESEDGSLYGMPTTIECPVPKGDTVTVLAPWISSAVSPPQENFISVGCAPVQWKSFGRINRVEYELLAQRIGSDNSTSQTLINLAQWSTDIIGPSNTHFRVRLSKTQTEYLPSPVLSGSYDQIAGRALEPKRDYALALRACSKSFPEPYTKNVLNSPLGRICYQSLWLNPVATDRPAPSPPVLRSSPDSDPDAVLWVSDSAAEDPSNQSNQPLPSDDATAHSPERALDIPLAYHGNQIQGAFKDITDNRDPVAQNDVRPNVETPEYSLSGAVGRKSLNMSMLITAISITVLILGIGLVCFLIIIYRRRRLEIRVPNEPDYNSWKQDGNLGRSKRWANRCGPGYSLLSWVNPNKHSPKHQMIGSVNLSEVHGPPPGSESVAANLHSTLSGFVPSYSDELASQASQSMCRPMSYRPGGTSGSGDLMNTTPYFGSLRGEGVHNNLTRMGSTDSANGTLYTVEPRGLHRTDSLPMGHLNRPMNTSSPLGGYPGQFGMRVGQPESLPGCNGYASGGINILNNLPSVGSGSGHFNSGSRALSLINTPPELPRLIEISQLVEHVQALKADNGRLMAAEFESIDPGGQFTWEHSNRVTNRPKNRYANVIAYDHSRVVLQPLSPDDPDSDYINANYLDGYRKQNAYIATQGPLPHTIADFWRMVWEQRSAMIVSMTRLEERARIKCEQYWPGGGSANIPLSCTASPSVHRIGQSRIADSKFWVKDKTFTNPINFKPGGFVRSDGEDSSLVVSNGLARYNASNEIGWGQPNADMLGEAVYGDITVGLLDTVELAYYTMRTFMLRRIGSSEHREVRQLQFTAWPDHGVPNHPAPLLMFLRRVRAECPPDSGPIVVHCSAGVGRTGAFILLDILLEQMRHEKAVDVFAAVSRLRSQRNFMVQTEDQYAFVYEALVEAASSGNTELTVRQLSGHWSRLTRSDHLGTEDVNPTVTTGLELEFSQLVSQTQLTKMMSSVPSSIGLLSPIDPISVHEDDKLSGGSSIPRLPPTNQAAIRPNAATHRANVMKNRNMDIIPHDANRVVIKAVRGVEGSDYINASYIDGYRSRAAYIATQTPLTGTLEDFWRMIWETGSCLIVRLESLPSPNDPKSGDAPIYWPTVNSARHGFLVIDPIATYTMSSYILRELRLTDTRDGTTRTVRQFDATPATDPMMDFEDFYYPKKRLSNPTEFIGQKDTGRVTKPSTSPTNTDPLLETSLTMGGGGSLNRITHRPLGANFKQQYQPMCEAILEVVIEVHKTKEHFGMEGPITVHCNLGAGRTGVFLAVALALERMRYEGVVDMFQTVKLLRWQRPGLVSSAAEYAFCYATALEYLESFERYAS
ncbi:unnamed protein product [Calicophoron daubneyi]